MLTLILVTFFGHLALCLGKSFSSNSHSPLCLLPKAALTAGSHSPGSLAITALATLLRSMFPPRRCSPLHCSRWVSPHGALQPSDIPQLFSRLWSWSLLLHFRPVSRDCCSDDALCVLSAGGSLHTGAFLQRSRPALRPVVLYVPALFSWRSRLGR